MTVVVQKRSDAAVVAPRSAIPRRATMAQHNRLVKPRRLSGAVGGQQGHGRKASVVEVWKAQTGRMSVHLQRLRRSLEPRVAPPVVAPRRISLGLGSVNRKEKIVARFVLHLQLSLLMKQTASMHMQLKCAPHVVHELEMQVGDWTLDSWFRRQNQRILANALFGLGLGLWELQRSWDVTKTQTIDSLEHFQLVASSTGTIIRLIIFASTVVLIKQLMDMYGLMVKEKHAISGKALFALKPAWPRRLAFRLLVEVGIVAIHPIPFLEAYLHEGACCLMFARLYLVCRVFRDYSAVYQQRKDIVQNRFLTMQSPSFTWFFSLQVVFTQAPLTVIVVVSGVIWACLTTCVYFFERRYQPEIFTLSNSAWYTYSLLTVHSPGFHPISWRGHAAAAIMVLAGLIFETLMVVAVQQYIGLDDKDRRMLSYLQDTETKAALSHRAAHVIKRWLRWQLARRRPVSPISRRTTLRRSPLSRAVAHEQEFWLAVERFHLLKNARDLAARSDGNPVLEKLEAIERDIVRVSQRIRGSVCAMCKGLKPRDGKPRPPVLADVKNLVANYDRISAQQREIVGLIDELLRRRR
ncbi:hypothetical protein ACHHYP_09191 [Achlya hypogyna]|uniref:Potassium channel domain-containing protein n=1 Tax=Achlya hypogyna TaxID=1202772 RepID=A0A1V9ZJD2_ACHHY|nr:hypothetical protein ACHHYP_09191 [Achlya hypogyna]